MLLNQIIIEETAEAGVTSVSNLGKIEYRAFPDLIKLYKRDDSNVPRNIAKIKRKKGMGWQIVVTEEWDALKLPHFGNVVNIRLPVIGKKTISDNLANLFKVWGISVDSFASLNKSENTEVK